MNASVFRDARCENCDYAVPVPLGRLQCQLNPPTVIAIPQANPLNPHELGVTPVGVFPPVLRTNWCSHFKRKGVEITIHEAQSGGQDD